MIQFPKQPSEKVLDTLTFPILDAMQSSPTVIHRDEGDIRVRHNGCLREYFPARPYANKHVSATMWIFTVGDVDIVLRYNDIDQNDTVKLQRKLSGSMSFSDLYESVTVIGDIDNLSYSDRVFLNTILFELYATDCTAFYSQSYTSSMIIYLHTRVILDTIYPNTVYKNS